MGVTGLWTVVQPCARPIKIETLNKKRLAVDASIWIYQFLKAVRDKEGNALRNSHVVGFFRRICKLLFIGIKPVFVFDGGAPALKRQTINSRKQRREGRRDDATRTAGKLLALQMQRIAEEEEQQRKQNAQRPAEREEEPLPENLVYVDELHMTKQEIQQSRKFKKKDQYHLPDLDMSLAEMGGPNDPRIMSLQDLEAYARQFDTGEDINVYDFSKIDYDGIFFTSLPASDRYNILNAARLRSRLRMGQTKEQLDAMFPDRMAFSKFQIERVQERNELTQRLMNINGMNDDAMYGINGTGRIAGEKGREYVLVKNDGVEGGWALGVVDRHEGVQSKPIDVDELDVKVKDENENDEDDEDFEDVPIEGLNRLPKKSTSAAQVSSSNGTPTRRRHAGRGGFRRGTPRRRKVASAKPVNEDPDSLFVAEVPEEEAEYEDVQEDDDENGKGAVPTLFSEDEDLNRAIALSLEKDDSEEEKIDWIDTFQQTKADEAQPLPKGRGQAIAHIVNSRANKVVPAARKDEDELDEVVANATTDQQTKPVGTSMQDSESEDDDMDFQAALAESRNTKHQSKPPQSRLEKTAPSARPSAPAPATAPKKTGLAPLPFEKLNLGSSLLGRKKMQKLQEDSAGGFERSDTGKEKKQSEALPPWFAGNLDEDIAAQKVIEKQDRQKAKAESEQFQFATAPSLQPHVTGEVIDVDEADEDGIPEVIDLESEYKKDDEVMILDEEPSQTTDEQPILGDVADAIRANPPVLTSSEQKDVATYSDPPIRRALEASQSLPHTSEDVTEPSAVAPTPPASKTNAKSTNNIFEEEEEEDEPLAWEDSDREDSLQQQPAAIARTSVPPTTAPHDPSESPEPDFEDVGVPNQPSGKQVEEAVEAPEIPRLESDKGQIRHHVTGTADQNLPAEAEDDEYGFYDDSDDDELMQQLAVEAEEHARFASTLNHKTQKQNVDDYERELKQLRSQQKKDRRDADEVTHVMVQECQQLLKLFGLPYITAPMEAEAQCAELVTLGLVDGIVTDDSDCFLFGGTRIYKNMFNQAKFVECYLTSDFEKEFDLTRQKLIGVAHLLGSDYTEGLPGVGPVSALEILSEFSSLSEFRKWWEGVQMNTIPKSEDVGNPFRRKFRRNATKLFLPPSFPDPRVEMAYMQPEVDSDPSQFQWGVPDLDALRSFLMATIGWGPERTDEVLVPVIRDMNRRMDEGTQSNITAFFEGGTGAGAYAPRQRLEQGSKRMGTALHRLAKKAKRKRKGVGEDGVPDEAEVAEPTPAPKKRAKRGAKRAAATADAGQA